MSALFSILFGGAFLVAAGVDPHVGGTATAICLVLYGVLRAAEVIEDYRLRQRLNHDRFLAEVYAANQRQREAREACERA